MLPNSEVRTTCKSCGQTFDQKHQFYEHFRAVHKRYSCSRCDYTSFGDRDLNNHTKITHDIDVQHVISVPATT